MTCVIVNRNYPPQKGITGHSANELAEFLLSRGIDVKVVHADGNYSGGGQLKNAIKGDVTRIRSFYSGKNKILRLIASLLEGRALIKYAIKKNPDVIITMTDPPLLQFWSGLYCSRKNIPWIYWSMDLYPEAFVAAKLISENNIFYKFLVNKITLSPPTGLIALGENQSEYIKKKYYNGRMPSVILPCGINHSKNKRKLFDFSDKISFCYAGNLGEAHDETFLECFINHIDPHKHILVLAIYGSKAENVIDFAKNKEGIIFVDNIERDVMHQIDVHLVSLKPEWDHICVPSKAVSAISEGASIIFNCSNENDNWLLLNDAAWRVNAGEKLDEQILDLLNSINNEQIATKRRNAREISLRLEDVKMKALSDIYSML
tara:strand:- start:1109 stop:2233 length:1125 start_codon:yes stop_codon:yes gene_type:complete